MNDELQSGIETDALLEHDPPGFRVEWVHWDSGFRRSGLALGDLVVGVEGRSLDAILKPGLLSKGVGQYAEHQYWAEIGATPERPVALNVLRDGRPLEIRGTLHPPLFYYDAERRPALAPGGPARLANDGFDGAWSSWLETTIKNYSDALLRLWVQKGRSTRTELAQHLESKGRIDALLAKYPGPFADAMLEDWTRVKECLDGRRIELGEADLEYRRLGERRLQVAKEEAAAAWEALRGDLAAETIPPFPAPSLGERGRVVGKAVELPRATYRNIVNDLGRAYMALGSPSDGYYFLVLETPDVFRFNTVMLRYKAQINPTMPEQYRLIGRVQDEPLMITVAGRPWTGLSIRPVGFLVGDDECFVDLRRDPAMFAGEDRLTSFAPIALDPSDPPERVVEALIQSIKLGDEKTWRRLFADWRVVSGAGGRTTIDGSHVPPPSVLQGAWERSRRNITENVLDARVAKVEPIKRVLARDTVLGLPDLEHVVVWVDHFGSFDGEVRAFKDLNVNRPWTLQRMNGGPWRIVSVQHL